MSCGCDTASGTLSAGLLKSMSPGESCICAYMMKGRSACASSHRISALPMPINPKVFTLPICMGLTDEKRGKLCIDSALYSWVLPLQLHLLTIYSCFHDLITVTLHFIRNTGTTAHSNRTGLSWQEFYSNSNNLSLQPWWTDKHLRMHNTLTLKSNDLQQQRTAAADWRSGATTVRRDQESESVLFTCKVEGWKNVVWSYESRFLLGHAGGRVRI